MSFAASMSALSPTNPLIDEYANEDWSDVWESVEERTWMQAQSPTDNDAQILARVYLSALERKNCEGSVYHTQTESEFKTWFSRLLLFQVSQMSTAYKYASSEASEGNVNAKS